jgi:hypothetical protein
MYVNNSVKFYTNIVSHLVHEIEEYQFEYQKHSDLTGSN